MISELCIGLTPGKVSPDWTRGRINLTAGGPETLLHWLETQLGLPALAVHRADRVTEYAGLLDHVQDATITSSMTADRWATAAELLTRRDELLLAGWDEQDSAALPPIVRDMATAVAGRSVVHAGEAERVRRVLSALDAGQKLPPHRCQLFDPLQSWPVLWQSLLRRLELQQPPQAAAGGPAGTAMHASQSRVLGAASVPVNSDASLRYVRTRSSTAAVEFVAAVLAAAPDCLSETVICCEDDQVAASVDACLQRLGLPTSGSSLQSLAHPVLQVLPLSVALCRDPLNAQTLLDFLTLPVCPVPRRAAAMLAAALTQEPGLGSAAWDEARQKLCAADQDPEGKLHNRLQQWLYCERVPAGDAIPARLIRERAALVAQWAAGRASLLERDESVAAEELQKALRIAAGQASMLGQLAESQGKQLTEPQLARILEEALAGGIESRPFSEANGGPVRVRSLAEVSGPCKRLIWLGLSTGKTVGSRWTVSQRTQLAAAGIIVDDGSHALNALRAAEARGYSMVREALLAITMPADLLQRWHPVWLAIRGLLPEAERKQPAVCEDLIRTNDGAALTPFSWQTSDCTIQPSQPLRPRWTIPAELLQDRSTVSATALQDRLACPLKWSLNYQAQLRSSSIAELPKDFQLQGTFCHSVLERVLGDGGELPSVETAVSDVAAAFDERLPLDAAPLAQPGMQTKAELLRKQLLHATQKLISTLAAGGYRIVGLEVPLEGQAFGKELRGSIDCLAVRADGAEAIIDFKLGGRNKYDAMIREGKAVQLATYAAGRAAQTGRFPAVAYLILSDGLMFTPSENAIAGAPRAAVSESVAIEDVWNQFEAAVERADEWMSGQGPIPARPLLSAAEWPAGSEFVLDADLKADELQQVCRYCDYGQICGLKETH